jgi:hypothetical protein
MTLNHSQRKLVQMTYAGNAELPSTLRTPRALSIYTVESEVEELVASKIPSRHSPGKLILAIAAVFPVQSPHVRKFTLEKCKLRSGQESSLPVNVPNPMLQEQAIRTVISHRLLMHTCAQRNLFLQA